MPKIVFFDLDRTTWDDDMVVPESTIEAVKMLKNNGNLAFVCTGRARSNINDKRIAEVGFNGIVAACGNHIEKDGHMLYENLLSRGVVEEALAAFERSSMPVIVEGPDYHWFGSGSFGNDRFVEHIRRDMGSRAKSISEITPASRVSKFTVGIPDGADVSSVIASLSGHLSSIIHYGKAIEFIPVGSSKASGIEKACKILGIAHRDTYAIGDGPNDIEMLEYAAHSICMGNGTPEAKAAAEYVTTDIHSDGVYNALKHYGLI